MASEEKPTLILDERAKRALGEAVTIMARLRRVPDGCPWDLEQTFDSIKKHTLEETYEVFDAIERRAWPELKDELGDLLLQVLFYAQIAADEGHFSIADVAENLNAKLVRRHPHIFGDVVATDAGAVLRNWEQIKLEEKAAMPKAGSLLDDVPRTMPATLEATKLASKAAKVGFDWPDSSGLFAKMDEELAELMVEVEGSAATGGKADSSPFDKLRVRNDNKEELLNDKQGELRDDNKEQRAAHESSARIEEEFGDLLFTAMNLARHLKIDAESALRRSNAKFRSRFAAMETAAGGADSLRALSLDELESLWAGAKAVEASR